jgi:hypothetical protein
LTTPPLRGTLPKKGNYQRNLSPMGFLRLAALIFPVGYCQHTRPAGECMQPFLISYLRVLCGKVEPQKSRRNRTIPPCLQYLPLTPSGIVAFF